MVEGRSTDQQNRVQHSAENRRGKAALFLAVCALAGLAPHWLAPGQSLIPSLVLAVLLGGYSIRTVLLDPPAIASEPDPLDGSASGLAAERPAVDVVVAARDEQAVIGRLVDRIASLRYPSDRLLLWVIDDGSEDRTPDLLRDLQTRQPQLRVLRRSRDAGGGKSGALNLVLPQLQGRWLLVLDADADLQVDVLETLIPWAEAGGWQAVQLRKAVANPDANLLTRAQAMEMAFDAVIQQGRLSAGGIAELRGNGQLLRRDAVLACGGFNEATVTDDLDLSMRLLLEGRPIGVLWDPPVQEEAVLSLRALWRQRQRWAEGGLQRFLDYAPGLVSDRLNRTQKLDLLSFFVLQYMMPVMAAADLLGVLITGSAPAMWPFSIVALSLSGLAIVSGCRRPSLGPPLPRVSLPMVSLGVLYLVHWFVVIPWVTLRMALLPKRLVWAKTLHHGGGLDDPEAEIDLDADSEAELAAEGGPL
jgi:1,2-diacylglycerol 3-beta-glucosyltransferase